MPNSTGSAQGGDTQSGSAQNGYARPWLIQLLIGIIILLIGFMGGGGYTMPKIEASAAEARAQIIAVAQAAARDITEAEQNINENHDATIENRKDIDHLGMVIEMYHMND